MNRVAFEEGLPLFRGKEARRQLFKRFGLPNAHPRKGEPLFGISRSLFVDDEQDGKPIAFFDEEAVVRSPLGT